MTKREFYEAIGNGTMNEEVKAFALAAIEKMDSANHARAAKQSEKAEKAYAPFIEAFVEAVKGSDEPMTATMILPMFEGMETPSGKEPTIQFVSSIGTKAVKAGLVEKIDVKVKGKGVQKGYIVSEH